MKRAGATASHLVTPLEPSEPSDGRIRRSQTSQQKIVNAMLALVAEGHMTPSAEQVAERAGIGLRSVFRHFKDMDSLYREMTRALIATIDDALRQPFKSLEWRARVLELVDRRAAVYEKLAPFLRAGQAQRQRSPVLAENHQRFVEALRQILISLLPREAVRDDQLVEAVDLLVSFEAWQRLREDQGLTAAKAQRVLKATIDAVLRAHDKRAT